MKVQRVYIDTSVIGGCFDEEFAPWSNGLMKDFQLGNFRPVVSKVVALEIVGAPEEVQEIYADILSMKHDFLDTTSEIIELADRYLQRGILMANYYDDAQHIALATVTEADLLTSWNFKQSYILTRYASPTQSIWNWGKNQSRYDHHGT